MCLLQELQLSGCTRAVFTAISAVQMMQSKVRQADGHWLSPTMAVRERLSPTMAVRERLSPTRWCLTDFRT